MASKIPGNGGKVYLHLKGMNELLKSPELEKELLTRMENAKAALPSNGQAPEVYSKQRPSRVVAILKRGSDFDEANTGDLSRALDATGGLRGYKIKTPKPKRGA